jgi:hypothetical protein
MYYNVQMERLKYVWIFEENIRINIWQSPLFKGEIE